MSKLKNSLVAFAGLIGLIAFVTPATGQGQGAGNQHPLNVNVVNTASGPALVRDVGMPLRPPVQIKVNTFICFGGNSAFDIVYTVPTGMRLIIEHVAFVSDNLVTGNASRGERHHPLRRRDCRSFPGRPYTAAFSDTVHLHRPMLALTDPGTGVTVTAIVAQPQVIQHSRAVTASYGELSPAISRGCRRIQPDLNAQPDERNVE